MDDELLGQPALGGQRARLAARLGDTGDRAFESVGPVRVRLVERDAGHLTLASRHDRGRAPVDRQPKEDALLQQAPLARVDVDDEHPAAVARQRPRSHQAVGDDAEGSPGQGCLHDGAARAGVLGSCRREPQRSVGQRHPPRGSVEARHGARGTTPRGRRHERVVARACENELARARDEQVSRPIARLAGLDERGDHLQIVVGRRRGQRDVGGRLHPPGERPGSADGRREGQHERQILTQGAEDSRRRKASLSTGRGALLCGISAASASRRKTSLGDYAYVRHTVSTFPTIFH